MELAMSVNSCNHEQLKCNADRLIRFVTATCQVAQAQNNTSQAQFVSSHLRANSTSDDVSM
jgi:hypothetical protein